MQIRDEVKEMKRCAPMMAATSNELRNKALASIIQALEHHKEDIFNANREDLTAAKEANIPESVQARLLFDDHKLAGCTEGIQMLIDLPDPIGKVQLKRELDTDLTLTRISVPIGVIGVIFEARPDALVQISTLCIKSGNCAVLKGGKETANTNRVLFEIVRDAAIAAGCPKQCLLQATAHQEIDELLSCEKDVDLLIPRGSNAFVRYIMDHTKIPVMGHADGICHTYLDKDANLESALPIILDAKTQYTAACNATETLLVDRAIAGIALPSIGQMLTEYGVTLRGTREALGYLKEYVDLTADCVMEEADFATEYLDMTLSVKLVDGVKEAAEHINQYGSHHTDAILTESSEAAAYFMQMVDSAGVYHNCSTRFADGFRYGFGAEVGISTSKIHARGPVGLEGLMTYRYQLEGNGQIVADYASGKSAFHFRDLA